MAGKRESSRQKSPENYFYIFLLAFQLLLMFLVLLFPKYPSSVLFEIKNELKTYPSILDKMLEKSYDLKSGNVIISFGN